MDYAKDLVRMVISSIKIGFQGTYADLTLYTCLACDKACLTCMGPLNTECLSCNQTLF